MFNGQCFEINALFQMFLHSIIKLLDNLKKAKRRDKRHSVLEAMELVVEEIRPSGRPKSRWLNKIRANMKKVPGVAMAKWLERFGPGD